MTTFRVIKNRDYTIMSNYHLKEKKMSLKAKGLLSLMLSLPEDWDYSIEGLSAISKESPKQIKLVLEELKKFNYLYINKLMPNQTKTGRIEYVYDIYEKPKTRVPKQPPCFEKQEYQNNPLVLTDNKYINNNTIINNTNNKNILNEFNIYNNFDDNLQCDDITKSTKCRCNRRSSFNINGKNYCNQHARRLIPNINIKKTNDICIKEKRNKYGTYGRVELTSDEYLRLVNEFGEEFIKKQIELLDEYVESNDNKNKYKNFNLVLRKSIRENWFKKRQSSQSNSFLDIMREERSKCDDN